MTFLRPGCFCTYRLYIYSVDTTTKLVDIHGIRVQAAENCSPVLVSELSSDQRVPYGALVCTLLDPTALVDTAKASTSGSDSSSESHHQEADLSQLWLLLDNAPYRRHVSRQISITLPKTCERMSYIPFTRS